MDKLSNQEILEKLKQHFGDAIISAEEPWNLLTVTVTKQVANNILKFLYDQLSFRFMTDLCGVHYPDHKNAELGVVYHLHNLRTNTRIRIKAFTPIENPKFPTATNIFETANWMERETYDFYGIIFEGHPNLKRILNMDEMVDFPMRKEFPLEDQGRSDKDDRMFGR